jgi:hypothetical protein
MLCAVTLLSDMPWTICKVEAQFLYIPVSVSIVNIAQFTVQNEDYLHFLLVSALFCFGRNGVWIRALHLQSMHSTTSATPIFLFVISNFQLPCNCILPNRLRVLWTMEFLPACEAQFDTVSYLWKEEQWMEMCSRKMKKRRDLNVQNSTLSKLKNIMTFEACIWLLVYMNTEDKIVCRTRTNCKTFCPWS